MSDLAGYDSGQSRGDASRRWVLTGIAASLLLHGGAMAVYGWKPSVSVSPAAPAAAPVVVSLVMPLASPEEDASELPPAKQKSQQTPAKPVEMASQPDAPHSKPVAKSPRQDPVALPVAASASPFRAQAEPTDTALANPTEKSVQESVQETVQEPVQETVQEAHDSKPPEKLTGQTQVASLKQQVKPVPEPLPETMQDPVPESAASAKMASAAQAASAPKGVKAPEKAETIAAPMQGQLNPQGAQQKLTWQRLLHAHLEQHKQFPRQARRFGRQGVPVVAFTMDRQGHVLSVTLVKSSGTRVLDNEAQAMVRRAEPLPLPPDSLAGERLTLTVPVSFRRPG
ncbi:energy transducer TonB [Photobacterium sp. 1_MG-2023]|uniref:energy transducer TonB n=1 Tax=Photobacterium sp. 1_MG-2023 TaxID=3062646 RepID=UPI0026E15BDA|nr:energy transducer TonB [Photobacterium sp. 1_MG-2023]MDO6707605.1 energy transducer TonB [Photobacterium sp. 1_MG-2023]